MSELFSLVITDPKAFSKQVNERGVDRFGSKILGKKMVETQNSF